MERGWREGGRERGRERKTETGREGGPRRRDKNKLCQTIMFVQK